MLLFVLCVINIAIFGAGAIAGFAVFVASITRPRHPTAAVWGGIITILSVAAIWAFSYTLHRGG